MKKEMGTISTFYLLCCHYYASLPQFHMCLSVHSVRVFVCFCADALWFRWTYVSKLSRIYDYISASPVMNWSSFQGVSCVVPHDACSRILPVNSLHVSLKVLVQCYHFFIAQTLHPFIYFIFNFSGYSVCVIYTFYRCLNYMYYLSTLFCTICFYVCTLRTLLISMLHFCIAQSDFLPNGFKTTQP